MADLEKKEEKSRQWKPYSCSELSAFCLQVSLLLEAAVPLDEGFSIMAEDAADEKERQMLLYMSEGAELGDPCFKIFKDTGVFPDYVIRMAKLGQETGPPYQDTEKCSKVSGYDDPYAVSGTVCAVCKGNAYFFKSV